MGQILLPEISQWKRKNDILFTDIPVKPERNLLNLIKKFCNNKPNYYICNESNNQNIIRVCKRQLQ